MQKPYSFRYASQGRVKDMFHAIWRRRKDDLAGIITRISSQLDPCGLRQTLNSFIKNLLRT